MASPRLASPGRAAAAAAASRRKPFSEPTAASSEGVAASPASSSSSSSSSSRKISRNSPYVPTPLERQLLLLFPALLLFGALFGVLAPETWGASQDDAARAAALQASSYFARKDNVVNVVFVKRGWFWITATFAAFVATHPFFRHRPIGVAAAAAAAASTTTDSVAAAWLARPRVRQAVVRWALVTGWWVLVTQWCFGPALIDRSFRLTGGSCEAVAAAAEEEATEDHPLRALALAASAAACKRGGGRWSGGHDISGHVFMLVLGSVFLAQELGWVLWQGEQQQQKQAGEAVAAAEDDGRVRRSVVMSDGTVRSAEVELEAWTMPPPVAPPAATTTDGTATDAATATPPAQPPSLAMVAAALTVRFATTVEALCIWMVLMTAIYFHTWTEKATGLVVALAGFYTVYIVPRWVPAVRRVVGVPGV